MSAALKWVYYGAPVFCRCRVYGEQMFVPGHGEYVAYGLRLYNAFTGRYVKSISDISASPFIVNRLAIEVNRQQIELEHMEEIVYEYLCFMTTVN